MTITMFLDNAASKALSEVLALDSGYAFAGHLKAELQGINAIAYRKPRVRTYAEAISMAERGLPVDSQAYNWFVFTEHRLGSSVHKVGFALPDLDDPVGWQRFYLEFKRQFNL